jgi:hypothetical protein
VAAERLYSQSEDVIREVVASLPSRRVTREGILILAVLAAALGMRILPIRSDLPYFSSMDEVSYIETALRFGTGAFQLSSYFHGALYQLILFLEYAAYFVLGRLFGLFGSPSDFFLAYLADPTPFFLFARMTAAVCGIGVVWLSYAIASRAYHPRVGVIAGLFTAFSLLLFQMSFLALADMPAVFLLMLATYLAVRSVAQPADRRLYCVAAALVGLAAACKYHVGLGVVILVVAAFIKISDHDRRIGALLHLGAVGSVFVFLGFLVGIPQVLIDPITFYDDVFRRLGGQYFGYDPTGNAWLFLFTHHLRNGLGIPLTVASLLGVGFALYTRSKWDLLLLSFPLSFYLLFAMRSVGFAYHLLPAVPFVLILAARLLDAVAERLLRRAAPVTGLVLAVIVVAPTFLDCLRLVEVMRSPGTKTLAKTWIEEHLPAETMIMSEGYVFTAPAYSPPLVENRSTLERDVAFVIENNGTGRTATMRLAHYDRLLGDAKAYDILKVGAMDSGSIARQRPRYLVTTSEKDGLAGELAAMFTAADYDQKRDAVKEHIQRDYEVLTTIAPTAAMSIFFPHLMDEDYRQIRAWPLLSDGGAKGPTITIWGSRSES